LLGILTRQQKATSLPASLRPLAEAGVRAWGSTGKDMKWHVFKMSEKERTITGRIYRFDIIHSGGISCFSKVHRTGVFRKMERGWRLFGARENL